MKIKKIIQFLEGNIKMLGDEFDLIPQHQREQVMYRSEICKYECMQYGYCIECGCSLPGKLYVKESCNDGKKFPDLMNKSDWEEFKIKNNIIIK